MAAIALTERVHTQMRFAAQQARARMIYCAIPEIAVAALRVARFVHDNGYCAVLTSGRSSVIAERLLHSAWDRLYPRTSPPKIYNFPDEANFLLYKGEIEPAVRAKNVQAYIDRDLSDLNSLKDEKVCFVDDHSVAGGKYNSLIEVFAALGFRRLDFAFLMAHPRSLHSRLRRGDYVAIWTPSVEIATLAHDIGKSDPELDHKHLFGEISACISSAPLTTI